MYSASIAYLCVWSILLTIDYWCKRARLRCGLWITYSQFIKKKLVFVWEGPRPPGGTKVRRGVEKCHENYWNVRQGSKRPKSRIPNTRKLSWVARWLDVTLSQVARVSDAYQSKNSNEAYFELGWEFKGVGQRLIKTHKNKSITTVPSCTYSSIKNFKTLKL